MPGSLLLGTDSDVSEYSGRSLDSKIGGKKVSFNKAVRVKQYPWNAATSEHLTLPSNRFWFKVYKNKPPVSNDYSNSTPKENNWDVESMECIHDSLTPIAEVDDQDIETSPLERNGYKQDDDFNICKSYDNQPTDPPVDYFDDMHLTSNRGINGARRVWEEDSTKRVYDSSNISSQWNDNGQEDKIDENSVKSYSTSMYDNTVLPHSNFRNDFTKRRSMRRLDNLNGFEKRERRSRSHDEYVDNDNRFKADKAVSTEDLNIGNGHISPSNRFFKGSRDIATQCYGTLTRNKNQSSFKNLNMSSQTNSYLSNTERLKNFKPQRPGLNLANDPNAVATSPMKDYSLEKVSSVIRTRTNSPKLHQISNKAGQNSKQIGQKFDFSSKASNDTLKSIGRTEKSISKIIQKQAFNRFNSKSEQNSFGIKTDRENASRYLTSREPNNTGFNPRTEFNSIDNKNHREISSREPNQFNPRLLDTKNNRENTNRNNTVRETHGIGFLRGHQIPLSEVNTNRKFMSTSNENHIPRKIEEVKCPDEQLSKGYQAKRYPPNKYERRSFRAKSEGSMIDWSLSGFQLASKPENSVSDSEYTVHRRPPLLMYIPGVSHHDRPAIEDDRLSALSDISRSEISSYAGDFRRRQSMREGKSKWLKWRSKS